MAFSTAVAATCCASIWSKVSPSLHAHPDPLPSVVRTVAVIVTLELESYANSPFEFASALEPTRHSMKPVETNPAARAISVTLFAASERSSGFGSVMSRSRAGG